MWLQVAGQVTSTESERLSTTVRYAAGQNRLGLE
jgi:hypothetical protein